jgi:hypothetical protein
MAVEKPRVTNTEDFMDPKIEFTNKESYLLHFYRDPQLCSSSRQVRAALYYVIPSIALVVVSFVQGAAVWSFVGYGLLLVYVANRLSTAKEWVAIMPNIIAKYEARIHALETKLLETEKKL